MKVGDLVKIEGGKLRPPWYGEVGIITSLSPNPNYTHGIWYEVCLVSNADTKVVRDDMLAALDKIEGGGG